MTTDTNPGEDACTDTEHGDPVRVAFVCVQNAGRSQMSAAFAERERERRGLDDSVEILTGGTNPAESVHAEVVDAMADAGFDLSDRTPRAITAEELRICDYVATMGCSTLDVGGVEGDDRGGVESVDGGGIESDDGGRRVDVRDWALADPDDADPAEVERIRDEIRDRVAALFDEIERAVDERSNASPGHDHAV